MSLQVWKIDSMRWRIGARWGPCPLFVFASRSGDRGVECFEVLFELCAAEVLVADQDQHPAALALAACDHLQADEFLVDFWGGQRERPWRAVQREQGVQQIALLLEALGSDYQIELHTEVPSAEFTVRPEHHGIGHRIPAPVVVSPETYRLDDFSALPNLVHCVNERAIDCIRQLATADVLVMSRSSFSYLGGILNRNGIVLYQPFWHQAPSSWMTVGPDGSFDDIQFRQAVQAL